MTYLTLREREVARLVASGHTNDEIASILAIAKQTVKNHICTIYRKLSVRNRVELSVRLTGPGASHVPPSRKRSGIKTVPSPGSPPIITGVREPVESINACDSRHRIAGGADAAGETRD